MEYKPSIIRTGSGIVRLGKDGKVTLIPNGMPYIETVELVDKTANGHVISNDGHLLFIPAGLDSILYED
jgi:hypothetical protein